MPRHNAKRVGSLRASQGARHGQDTGSEGRQAEVFYLLLQRRVSSRYEVRYAMLLCAASKDHFSNAKEDELKG